MTEGKLPWDIKQQCLWIVRGYERARRDYIKDRMDILHAGGENYVTYTAAGEERRAYMPHSRQATRTAENIALQLEALEQSAACRQMRAVEHARARIGAGLPEALQDALQEGLMLNCKDGRKWPYERLFLIGICRSDFYRARDAFFQDIAEEVGLWKKRQEK